MHLWFFKALRLAFCIVSVNDIGAPIQDLSISCWLVDYSKTEPWVWSVQRLFFFLHKGDAHANNSAFPALSYRATMMIRAGLVRPVALAAQRTHMHVMRQPILRMLQTASSVDPNDIAHFSRLADQWWDESGEFAPLHRMNRVRIEFMQQKLEEVRGWDAAVAEAMGYDTIPTPLNTPDFLSGSRMLDVGCGGGLLVESAARLGACVTGVDASSENIRIASLHASKDPGLRMRTSEEDAQDASLAYLATSAETLRNAGRTFDIVTAMEVVEHVNQPAEFLRCLGSLVKPGGHLFMSTMSRTMFSYFLTIFLAENVLQVVTPGTHRHSQYIHPFEMVDFFRELGWIPSDASLLANRPRLKDGSPIAPVPPRLLFETRGTMYVPGLGRWILAPPSVADASARGEASRALSSACLPSFLGGGMRPTELCNYFFWIRRPTHTSSLSSS